MRINAVKLSWFRGAADSASLELDGRSMVVYGMNGSGKSSFVDAVEYVIREGKIGHLAHEYSGRRQQKAIPNTHKPRSESPKLEITFADGSQLKTRITAHRRARPSVATAVDLSTWEYGRTILRQDEVAAFIHNTKGEKYSALLPLLGLHQMEVAAENLRKLAMTVQVQSKLAETKSKLQDTDERRKAIFGEHDYDQILTQIKQLHDEYCSAKPRDSDPLLLCEDLETALDTRMQQSSVDQKRHFILQDIAKFDLRSQIDAVRAASGRLADAVGPLIKEKLEVLQSTRAFVDKLGAHEQEVKCPACGRLISVDTFQEHVRAEHEKLHEIIGSFDSHKAALRTLSQTVKSLQLSMNKTDIKSWRNDLAKGPLEESLEHLEGIDSEVLRRSCNENDLKAAEGQLLPLIDAASSAAKDAPPDAQQLSTDKQEVAAAKAVIAAKGLAAAVKRTETLISFINSLEKGIRDEIRLQSETVVEDISSDIQAMWAILHPKDAIEEVRLYVPCHADKAIEIGLKFYGVEQESPRLTLSEGYRNSLGLCIFLAMAKREAENDRPLFLDDVVISLDRDHRGMVAGLLEEQFSDRQVVILTHDRDWYTELRHKLDARSWNFKALLPYHSPEVGIRWAKKTTSFDDARAQLDNRPYAAGTEARKIMDVELAVIAEHLQLKLPYLRGTRNDFRMAHDFLQRIVADGKKCFQQKDAETYERYTDALDALEVADKLILAWANRATHTGDLVRSEASQLIAACEEALDFFKCSSCNRAVWFSDARRSGWVQCHCGHIRWRYSKG